MRGKVAKRLRRLHMNSAIRDKNNKILSYPVSLKDWKRWWNGMTFPMKRKMRFDMMKLLKVGREL